MKAQFGYCIPLVKSALEKAAFGLKASKYIYVQVRFITMNSSYNPIGTVIDRQKTRIFTRKTLRLIRVNRPLIPSGSSDFFSFEISSFGLIKFSYKSVSFGLILVNIWLDFWSKIFFLVWL